MTEPAVGACTCASGSQVCTGHMGIFTAKEAKKGKPEPGLHFARELIGEQLRDVGGARLPIIAIMQAASETEPSSVVEEELVAA